MKAEESEEKKRAERCGSFASSILEESEFSAKEDLEDEGALIKDAKVVFEEIQEHSEVAESKEVLNLDEDLIEVKEMDSDIEVLFGKQDIASMCASRKTLVK